MSSEGKTLAVHPASTYYRRKPHEQGFEVVLSSIDRQLLQRCLDREEQAWSEFVDRFLGLVLHVVEHTSGSRGISIPRDLRDDLTAEVFASLIRDDFGILRKFRSHSSLATYLTVVARRIVVRKLQQLKLATERTEPLTSDPSSPDLDPSLSLGAGEEVERALDKLAGNEAAAVRMFYLEGKSYQEISNKIGMPENSVGPMLSRARAKMKETLGR